MGQRSQIYVRYNGKLILARYYQWNYGERMISRARYGIENLKYYVENGYDFAFRSAHEIEKMVRIFDTNFDMKDVQISSDIFKEWESEVASWESDGCDYALEFYEHVFAGQDNNDGQLFIDIIGADKNGNGEIKYAFFSGDGYDEIMTAKEYMDWDNPGRDWQVPVPYMDEETIKLCNENIDAINDMAQLMTRRDVNSFLATENYFGQPEPF